MTTSARSARPPILAFRGLVVMLVAGFGFGLGCSSSSSDGASNDGGTSDAAASGSCELDCDHQAAAGCPKTPAGYADACKLLCGATRAKVAATCASQLEAQFKCQASTVTYSCNGSGVLTVSPVGACAAEAAACASCNGGKVCSAAL